MKEYKYKGETFQLDDSARGYVAVTYENLTGYVGVNLGTRATDEKPFVWYTAHEVGGDNVATSDGLRFGIISHDASFEANLDALCGQLLLDFRAEEKAKAGGHEKHRAEMHDAVKDLP